ncbi:MAG: replication initiator protein [Microvirus sp.]|nr:MAG: replication initiator protein [Microvirus sp.]
MPCYKPRSAYIGPSGPLRFAPGPGLNQIDIACRWCIGCRLDRSRDWATRIHHEASLHAFNAFVTLTYNAEHYPPHGQLLHEHFVLFMKKLRHHIGPTRYFMCGEYGEKFARPHFHAALFGLHFDDRKLFSENNGQPLYTSKLLDSLWDRGFATIGDLSIESARYITGYVVKKIIGKKADQHYTATSPHTGEQIRKNPEYAQMSRRPGIGAAWFDRYATDVFPHDRCIIQGREVPPPAYYYRKLKERDSIGAALIKNSRQLRSTVNLADRSDSRLKVRELVARKQHALKTRLLEKS